MTEEIFPAGPTASSLKKELGESLEQLKRDFDGLKKFVAEIAPEGVPSSLPLSIEDVHELLAAALEIHDAAEDIAFEATVIKDKLKHSAKGELPSVHAIQLMVSYGQPPLP